jgi:membrane protease YdiL (CAAX protease family)
MTIEETNREEAALDAAIAPSAEAAAIAGAAAAAPPDAAQTPAAAAPPAPWRMGAARAWLIFLAYFAVQLFVGFVVGIGATILYLSRHGVPRHARLPLDLQRAMTLGGGMLAMVAAAAIAYWLVTRVRRREPGVFRAIGWAGATLRVRAFAVACGLALGIALLALLAAFPPPKDFRPGPLVDSMSAGGWLLAAWIAIAIAIAPPVEEFVFRGVMWTGIARSWDRRLAGAAVTAVFVALHLPETGLYVPAIAAIAALGLATLAIRVASGSLVPAVLLHASYNAVIVLAVLAGFAGGDG